MNLHNIHAVAQYERKLLMRSWLFRIFILLALLFALFAIIQTANSKFIINYYLSIPSQSSLFIAHYVSYIQAILVVFLAGNFLSRDRKIDTAEVLFVRPISNGDYIIGKTLGVLSLFVLFNMLIFTLTIVLYYLIGNIAIDVIPPLVYLFFIIVPAMIFTIGVSYNILLWTKNQAISLLLTLGTVLTLQIYLGKEHYRIFDVLGVEQMLQFSTISGIEGFETFAWQRSIYFILGLALVALTVAQFKRIDNKKWSKVMALCTAITLLGIASILTLSYYFHFKTEDQNRVNYQRVFNEGFQRPLIDIIDCSLKVNEIGDRLDMQAKILLTTLDSISSDSIFFYLNPDLLIRKIDIKGQKVNYTRDNQLVAIPYHITPQDTLSLQIEYAGGIDMNIAFTDSKKKDLQHITNNQLRKSERYWGYLSSEYVLLNPELLWYPISVPVSNPKSKYALYTDYVNYDLIIDSITNKKIFTQGKVTKEDNLFHFVGEVPTSGINLIIGEYDIEEIMVDSIRFAFYHSPLSTNFIEQYTPIKDSIPSILKKFKENVMHTQGHPYPFSQFVVIETPLHYQPPYRAWRKDRFTFPELVYHGEFNQSREMQMNTNLRKGKKKKEISGDEVAKLSQEFEGNATRTLFSGERQIIASNTGSIYFEEVGVMDYILKSLSNPTAQIQRGHRGRISITTQMRANYFLGKNSLKDALASTELADNVLNEVIKLKGNELGRWLRLQMGDETYVEFINSLASLAQAKTIKFNEIQKLLQDKYGVNIKPFIQVWLTQKGAPTIKVLESTPYKVSMDDVEMYRTELLVHNASNYPAIISTQVMSRSKGGRGGGKGYGGGGSSLSANYLTVADIQDKKLYQLAPQSYYRIVDISEDYPSGVHIDFNIANNIPMNHNSFFPKVKEWSTDTIKGIFPIDSTLFTPIMEEIIIDNEDEGFSIHQGNIKKNKIKDWIKARGETEESDYAPSLGEYQSFQWWRMPTEWTPILVPTVYGFPYRSALYCKSGTGDSYVTWEHTFEEAGYYDLSVKSNFIANPWGNNIQELYQNYIIEYDGEKEDLKTTITQKARGWISLGEFYFDKGMKVQLSLTNKTESTHVVADAIKYVKLD